MNAYIIKIMEIRSFALVVFYLEEPPNEGDQQADLRSNHEQSSTTWQDLWQE